MSVEQQPKRRRTESRATLSPPAETSSAKHSPAPARYSPPPSLHSLPAIRSPTAGSLQPMPPMPSQPAPQPQLEPQQQQYQYQYQYYTQPQPQPAMPAYSQASDIPASSAANLAPVQARFISAATTTTPQPPGLVGHLPPGTTPASAQSQLAQPQAFVSPHGIPTALLGHGSAVANADYGAWLYPHQQVPPPDRSSAAGAAAGSAVSVAAAAAAAAATAGVGGVGASASVSPITQQTIASADHSYSLQSHFDPQMRYMAMPGQASGIPKPMASAATLPIDRALRPISMAGQQQQQQQQHHNAGLMAMQYHPSQVYPASTQYHAGYYHPQHQAHQHPLQPAMFAGQHAQQQQQQQHSPFPTHASVASATAPMSDSSSTQTSIGAPPGSSMAHSGHYGSMHPGAADLASTEHVSASQVAAAVAAAASANAGPAGSNTGNSVSGPGNVVDIVPNRLGISMHDAEQSALPAFKFSMNLPPAPESRLPEYLDSYSQGYVMGNPPIMEPGPASPAEQTLDADLMARLDDLFMKYLEAICSNNITVDSEGESIHQTQMAKKLEKLEQCTEYRTFRFRIQAFSNGYREFIEREAGLTEQAVSKQQLRNYLHQQHYISRYNEDGKKAKSKGHHVWNVEAKKISRNTWWFKEFVRRIASPPPKAVIGVPYEWTPTIWDPQIKAPKVYFNSEWLPSWLRWENNSLRGLPPTDAADCNVVVIASYYQGKEVCHLRTNFTIHVVPHTPGANVFLP